MQVQAVTLVLEIGDMVLTGQVTQVDEIVAAVAEEYVPVPQLLHDALPLAILYFPAAHSEHAPSGPVYPALQMADTHGPPAGPA